MEKIPGIRKMKIEKGMYAKRDYLVPGIHTCIDCELNTHSRLST